MPKKQPNGWNPSSEKKVPSTKTLFSKVNLEIRQFDDLIQTQGVRVRVYRSVYCSNVKSIDGSEHEIDCPLCNGSQFIDRHPIETTAFIQSQTQERHNLAEGGYDGNTVAATFMQGIELQYFTLVELLDFTDIFFERIKRQRGEVDVLKYPGIRVNFLIDSKGKEYYEGSDFSIDQNGNIRWKLDKGPFAGDIYSVHYEMATRFRAVSAMHSNRFVSYRVQGGDRMVKMNEQWLLQKSFLVDRRDQNGIQMKNKIRDEDEEW